MNVQVQGSNQQGKKAKATKYINQPKLDITTPSRVGIYNAISTYYTQATI
jgi:hypothetical protein